MKRSIIFTLAILALLLFVAIPVRAGGWVVITLSELPTRVVAGEMTTVEFAVRQHGAHPTSLFGAPTVYVTHAETGEKFSVNTEITSRVGYYTADLVFPESGTWNWSVGVYDDVTNAQTMPPLEVALGANSLSSANSTLVSMPMVLAMIGLMTFLGTGVVFFATRSRWTLGIGVVGIVLMLVGVVGGAEKPVAAATVPPSSAAVSQVELGKALFLSKGCVVCHSQAEARLGFTGIQTNIGPNLTNTKLPVEYIEVWLKDPTAIKPDTMMPNLDLKKTEIDALAAFLTAGQ